MAIVTVMAYQVQFFLEPPSPKETVGTADRWAVLTSWTRNANDDDIHRYILWVQNPSKTSPVYNPMAVVR